jgi:hypothetical protein
MAMSESTKKLAIQLREIPWYENIGQEVQLNETPPTGYIRVKNLEDAVESIQSQSWAHVRFIERRGRESAMMSYSERFFGNHFIDFGKEITTISEEIYELQVLPKFTNIVLPERVFHQMLGNINGILFEEETKWLYRSGFYVETMLFWHSQGLWPCGWQGNEYPNGKMLVY